MTIGQVETKVEGMAYFSCATVHLVIGQVEVKSQLQSPLHAFQRLGSNKRWTLPGQLRPGWRFWLYPWYACFPLNVDRLSCAVAICPNISTQIKAVRGNPQLSITTLPIPCIWPLIRPDRCWQISLTGHLVLNTQACWKNNPQHALKSHDLFVII